MKDVLLLVERHLRIYFSSLSNIFFTLLSNLISIGVYLLFLFENSVDNFSRFVPVEQLDNVNILMLLFLLSGQIMVMMISASFGNADILIKDTQYTGSDMSVWAISKMKIMISYVLQTVILTVGFSLVTLSVGLLYIYIQYAYVLPIVIILQIVGIIIISGVFASLVAVLVTSLMKSLRSYGSFTVIINTLSGFLLGIYMPLGLLPNFVQKIVLINPYFNYMHLFRNIMMKDIIAVTFEGVPEAIKTEVLEVYGLFISSNAEIFPLSYLPLVMGISFIIIFILTMVMFKKKRILR